MFNYLERLNEAYTNYVNRISKTDTYWLILLTVLIEVSVTILFSYFLFPNHTSGPKFENNQEEFLIAVILAPFLETLIFQYAIISFILNKMPKALLFSCFVSAVLFGLSHFYSPEYVLKTFFSGLLFGTLYLIVLTKKANAILIVSTAHAIFNLIGFFVKNFT